MDVTILFGFQKLKTAIYVKLKAPDPLLLSESVCQRLGIIQYHPLVDSVREAEESQEQLPKRETRTHNRPVESTANVKMIHTV